VTSWTETHQSSETMSASLSDSLVWTLLPSERDIVHFLLTVEDLLWHFCYLFLSLLVCVTFL